MKKFLILCCLFLSLILAAGCYHKATAQLNDIHNLRQIITKDSNLTRTIMWESKGEHPRAFIEYKEENADSPKTATAKEKKFTEDKTTNYIYTAFLTNLKPGTSYTYRVGYENRVGPWEKFTTAKGAAFKALIFPDTQSSDYTGWQQLAKTAWEKNQDAELYLNMGDLVDNGESAYQWEEWFKGAGIMSKSIPLAPVLGNHETYTLDWKVRMPIAYLNYFELPANGSSNYQNQYYSFDYGQVHFVVLNSIMKELDQFQPDMLKEQIAWLKRDLATTDKKWRVALLHKDVLQYGFKERPQPRPEGISTEGEIFMPLFEELKVDAVLTAHLHTYRRRGHIANFTRDDHGPLYLLTGVAGSVRYPNLWRNHALDEYVAPQPETANYLTLEAQENSLKFSCFLPTGEKLDTVVLTKQ